MSASEFGKDILLNFYDKNGFFYFIYYWIFFAVNETSWSTPTIISAQLGQTEASVGSGQGVTEPTPWRREGRVTGRSFHSDDPSLMPGAPTMHI